MTGCSPICALGGPAEPFGPFPLWLFDLVRLLVLVLGVGLVALSVLAIRRCALRSQQFRFAGSAVFSAVVIGGQLDNLGTTPTWRLFGLLAGLLLMVGGAWPAATTRELPATSRPGTCP